MGLKPLSESIEELRFKSNEELVTLLDSAATTQGMWFQRTNGNPDEGWDRRAEYLEALKGAILRRMNGAERPAPK